MDRFSTPPSLTRKQFLEQVNLNQRFSDSNSGRQLPRQEVSPPTAGSKDYPELASAPALDHTVEKSCDTEIETGSALIKCLAFRIFANAKKLKDGDVARAIKSSGLMPIISDPLKGRHNDPIRCYMEICQYLQNLDYQPLKSFLLELHNILPDSAKKTVNCQKAFLLEKQAMLELMEDAGREGLLDEHYQPHPAVEKWVQETARAVRDRLLDSAKIKAGSSEVVLEAIGVSCLLAYDEIASYSRQLRRISKDFEPEVCLAGSSIHQINMSLFYQLCHELLPDLTEKERRSIESRFDQLSKKSFCQSSLILRSSLEPIATSLRQVQTLAQLWPYAIRELRSHQQKSKVIAEAWENSQLHNRAARADLLRHDLVFPFGTVTLVFPLGGDQEKYLYGCFDGGRHERCLAYYNPRRKTQGVLDLGSFLPGSEFQFEIKGVVGVFLDNNNKVYAGTCARLAPACSNSDFLKNAESIRQGADYAYSMLLQLWENHPSLFGRVAKAGPLIFVLDFNQTILICRQEIAPVGVRQLSAEEQENLFRKLSLSFSYPMASCLIKESTQEVTLEVPIYTENDFLTEIRSKIPNGKFEYKWLLQALTQFNVRVNTEKGAGSHYALERKTGDGVFSYTISKSFRTNTQKFPHLKRLLNELRIGYQEFYESLE